jgi:hypothetical protein
MNIKLTEIGNVSWTYDDIKICLDDFLELYTQRPIKNNKGGMSTPHCFAVYFLLKKLNKPYIVESGVWKGQSTWLIENTCPTAKIISIDPNLNRVIYISNKVQYTKNDWSTLNLNNTEQYVCFFDDHQNAVKRIKHAIKNNYKYLIFEDNYPTGQGDCVSLKQTFDADNVDSKYIRKYIKTYYEFPPVFKKNKTRWGDNWCNEKYPTQKPLFKNMQKDVDKYKQFYDDATDYTWITYVELI